MITKEDILKEAELLRKEYPCYRKGQAIFNYVDMHPELFGNAARISQFNYGIDCFYRDDMIDQFIDQVLEIVNNQFID
jgi:hypothetical protein